MYIESHRKKPLWWNNHDRGPSFLPSVFELRVFLVPLHPRLAAANEPAEKQFVDYAGQVSELLVITVNTSKIYHREISQLQTDLLDTLSDLEKVKVALCLGDLTDMPQPTTIEYLQIELSHWLLQKTERCIRSTPALFAKCE